MTPPPTPWEEAIHNLLEYLAVRAGLTYTPSEVLESIRLHRSLYPELNRETFYELVGEVAPHYGIKVHRVKKSLKEIKYLMTKVTPFVPLLWNDEKNEPYFISFLNHQAKGFLIQEIGYRSGVENWINEAESEKIIGVNSQEEYAIWLVSEPIYTFSNLGKNKSDSSPLKMAILRITHLAKLERSDIWIVVIYGIGIGILSLVVPVATSTLVNIVAFGVLLQPVLILTFLVILFLGFAAVMQVIQTYVVEILQRRVFVRIATEFATHIPRIKPEALQYTHRPELVNRFFDTMTIQKSINNLLVDGLAVFLTTVIGFILISFYHPFFLIFSFLVLGIGFYLVIFRFGKKASFSYLEVSKGKYKVAAWLEEIARHNSLFRSTFGSDFGIEKTDTLTRDYLSAREKYFSYLIRQIIGFLMVQAIASAIVLGLGGFLVIERQLTIGQLVAAELIIAKILSDLSKFGKQLESFYSLLAAMDKIGEVLGLPREPIHLHPFEVTGKPIAVSVENVDYALPNGMRIFEKFNAEFPSGSRTMIVGNIPFQSQILVDLLAGFRKPELGAIEFDRQDIAEISQEDLHMDIYVARGNEIFEGTVLENLRVGREKISLLEIREVLEELSLWEMIQSLPKGIHTQVLTYGSPFDFIQSNKLLLARAVLGQPRLLIVDGIIDILPEESRKQVLDYICAKNKPWTLIVVSRLTNLVKWFQVLEMPSSSGTISGKKKKGILNE